MAGELWRRQVQIGKEVTAGTAVAATRKLYLRDFNLAPTRATTSHRYDIGTPDNVLAITQGADEVGGSASMVMSADEILEPLLIGMQGGVTPTTPAGATLARLWTFKPSLTVDSATNRYSDAANTYVGAGIQVNQYTFAGSATGDNTVDMDLFGLSRVAGALTGALADRTPTFLEGWQTNVYIDAFGGTPGTTLVGNAIMNHSVTVNRNLGRKYFYNNTKAAGAITSGLLEIAAQVTFEASAAAAATELANWDANTPRLMRLEFLGPVDGIETGQRRFVTLDVAGHWSEPDLAGEDGDTRTYQMTLAGRYDSVNAFTIQVRAQNTRTTAY